LACASFLILLILPLTLSFLSVVMTQDWALARASQVEVMMEDRFRMRAMRPDEIALAADWAAAEGWNPGLADAMCFGVVDPEGFLLGELDGAPAATISVINYDDRFAFLGFYIVRPDLRGCGYGWRMWQAGLAHAASRTIGLDGVLAQQENYKTSGFALAYRNVRHGGTLTAPTATGTVALTVVSFASLEAEPFVRAFAACSIPFLPCITDADIFMRRA
jgi:GNAT superfamily N-acetyltransferase